MWRQPGADSGFGSNPEGSPRHAKRGFEHPVGGLARSGSGPEGSYRSN